MNRIAFTICLNSAKHLLRNGYYDYLLSDVLDYLVVCEGAVKSGSSPYCVGDNSNYHMLGRSIDSTNDVLDLLRKKYPDKIFVIRSSGIWQSKTAMCNEALLHLKTKFKKAFLWQIDADEQWTKSAMKANENALLKSGAKVGAVKFNQFVGKNIIAVGEYWGGNTLQRLWIWDGDLFITHEPPVIENEGLPILLPEKFNHYSYVEIEDVRFKSNWYGYGYGFFERWEKLQTQTEFPRPLAELFPQYDGEIIKYQ